MFFCRLIWKTLWNVHSAHFCWSCRTSETEYLNVGDLFSQLEFWWNFMCTGWWLVGKNPECMKESCRLCKELSHIPLRCEEVEKKEEALLRTKIENKMTDALLRLQTILHVRWTAIMRLFCLRRTCWRCRKRFFKVEGCNHVLSLGCFLSNGLWRSCL